MAEIKKWIPVFSICFSFIALGLSCNANYRSDKLYVGQKMSAIQVTPLNFEEYIYDNQHMGKMEVQVTNYTGFRATNLIVDANFENVWIREWVKAAVKGLDEQEKKSGLSEQLKNEFSAYKMSLAQNSFDIEPGNSINHISQGGINFDRTQHKIIMVRVSWTSENGAQFDKIFKYQLMSTRAYEAESLTLIPSES